MTSTATLRLTETIATKMTPETAEGAACLLLRLHCTGLTMLDARHAYRRLQQGEEVALPTSAELAPKLAHHLEWCGLWLEVAHATESES